MSSTPCFPTFRATLWTNLKGSKTDPLQWMQVRSKGLYWPKLVAILHKWFVYNLFKCQFLYLLENTKQSIFSYWFIKERERERSCLNLNIQFLCESVAQQPHLTTFCVQTVKELSSWEGECCTLTWSLRDVSQDHKHSHFTTVQCPTHLKDSGTTCQLPHFWGHWENSNSSSESEKRKSNPLPGQPRLIPSSFCPIVILIDCLIKCFSKMCEIGFWQNIKSKVTLCGSYFCIPSALPTLLCFCWCLAFVSRTW